MSSRFKALFEEAKQETPTNEKSKKKTVQKPSLKAASEVKPSRPKGKRSNPNYMGAFAYIPINLHEEVKIALLRGKELDFSELVEKLLTNWLKEQK
jgi:hypothetical protein